MTSPTRLDPTRRPPDLTEEEADLWDQQCPRLIEWGTLTETTRPVLAAWCRASVRFEEAALRGDDDEKWEAARVAAAAGKRLGMIVRWGDYLGWGDRDPD